MRPRPSVTLWALSKPIASARSIVAVAVTRPSRNRRGRNSSSGSSRYAPSSPGRSVRSATSRSDSRISALNAASMVPRYTAAHARRKMPAESSRRRDRLRCSLDQALAKTTFPPEALLHPLHLAADRARDRSPAGAATRAAPARAVPCPRNGQPPRLAPGHAARDHDVAEKTDPEAGGARLPACVGARSAATEKSGRRSDNRGRGTAGSARAYAASLTIARLTVPRARAARHGQPAGEARRSACASSRVHHEDVKRRQRVPAA